MGRWSSNPSSQNRWDFNFFEANKPHLFNLARPVWLNFSHFAKTRPSAENGMGLR